MLSVGVSLASLFWIPACVLTVEAVGIGSMEIGSINDIKSSDIDAAAARNSFQTIDQGRASGLRTEITEIYRTKEEYEAFWARHSSDDAPSVDFGTRMVAAVFMGEQVTGGFSVEVTSVEQQGDGGRVVNFATTAPAPGALLAQMLTQPYHIVSLGATDKHVTFEGSQAAQAPTPKTSMYMVSFEKGVNFAEKVSEIKNDPRVNEVTEMKALKMAFVKFDPNKTKKDEMLAFLKSVKGVKHVEEDK